MQETEWSGRLYQLTTTSIGDDGDDDDSDDSDYDCNKSEEEENGDDDDAAMESTASEDLDAKGVDIVQRVDEFIVKAQERGKQEGRAVVGNIPTCCIEQHRQGSRRGTRRQKRAHREY